MEKEGLGQIIKKNDQTSLQSARMVNITIAYIGYYKQNHSRGKSRSDAASDEWIQLRNLRFFRLFTL